MEPKNQDRGARGPRAEKVILRMRTPHGAPLDTCLVAIEPPGSPADFPSIPPEARTIGLGGFTLAYWLDRPEPLRPEFASAVAAAWDGASGPEDDDQAIDDQAIDELDPPSLVEAVEELAEARAAYTVGAIAGDVPEEATDRLLSAENAMRRRLMLDHAIEADATDPSAVAPVGAAIVGSTLFAVTRAPWDRNGKPDLLVIDLDQVARVAVR